MNTRWHIWTWGLWFVLGVLLITILVTPLPAQAATKYWVGGDGNWNDPGHWNPVGQPIGDDWVILSNSYGTQITYRNESYPDAVLGSLQINASISGTMTLIQSLNYPLHSQLEIVGITGQGAHIQSNGMNNIQHRLFLGYDPGSFGTYDLRSGGLSAPEQYIGYKGDGLFLQTGGTNTLSSDGVTINGELYLGHQPGSIGHYDMYYGQLDALNQYIGYKGRGYFSQHSGINNVLDTLSLGFESGSNGSYYLRSGGLSVKTQIIGDSGTGIFTQSGGINNVTNSLILAANPGSTGTYDLQGGSLSAGTIQINSSGTFTVTGSPSFLTTTVTGDVNNAGAVNTTNADITWDGTITLKGGGVYHSDSATQTFNDLVVEPTGYVIAASQDTFIIKNDLENSSTRNTDWNTRDAVLQFVQGDDSSHDLYLPGADKGPNWGGYDHNFAWGTLRLCEVQEDGTVIEGTEQTVHLVDGNPSNNGTALYVGVIQGLVFDPDDPLLITNIYGAIGLNIYYDPTLNTDLGGLTYNFSSWAGEPTGYLAPIPVPASVLLLGSGLLGLGFLGFRRKRG